MFSYLSGILSDWTDDGVVIDVQGIGFFVEVPSSSISRLPAIGSEVKLHTVMLVSENNVELVGFLTKEELKMFNLLRKVNKVGTKMALSLLSTLTVAELSFAIASQDAKAIAKAPGVGVKMAEKLILELKDKVGSGLVSEEFQAAAEISSEEGSGRADAIEALVALGFGRSEAVRSVSRVKDSASKTAEEIIREALRQQ